MPSVFSYWVRVHEPTGVASLRMDSTKDPCQHLDGRLNIEYLVRLIEKRSSAADATLSATERRGKRHCGECGPSPPNVLLTIPLLDSRWCSLHCSEAREEESSEETGAHLDT